MGSTYWARRASRRNVLRGASLGVAGLAGAALIGCGGDDDGGSASATAGPNQAGATITATAVPTEAAGGTPVPADQVRVKPGVYDGPVPPSAAASPRGARAGRCRRPPRS